VMSLLDVTAWCHCLMSQRDVTAWCHSVMSLLDVTAWCFCRVSLRDVTYCVRSQGSVTALCHCTMSQCGVTTWYHCILSLQKFLMPTEIWNGQYESQRTIATFEKYLYGNNSIKRNFWVPKSRMWSLVNFNSHLSKRNYSYCNSNCYPGLV